MTRSDAPGHPRPPTDTPDAPAGDASDAVASGAAPDAAEDDCSGSAGAAAPTSDTGEPTGDEGAAPPEVGAEETLETRSSEPPSEASPISDSPPSETEDVAPAQPATAGVVPRQPSFLRRFFLLEDRVEAARRALFSRKDPGFAQFKLAECALRGADTLRDAGDEESQLLLHRAAATLAATAAVLREGSPAEETSRTGVWGRFAETAIAKSNPGQLSPEQVQTVEQTLQQRESELAELGLAEHRLRLAVLRRFNRALMRELQRQANVLFAVRFTRVLRIGGVAALAVALVAAGVFLARLPRTGNNLALGKSVTASSTYDSRRFPARGLTDGNARQIGVHTKLEPNPWVQIDLGELREITVVEVTNRDQKQERAVPLVIEVSPDGMGFSPFARRTDKFRTWKAEGRAKARYVRLSTKKRTELHLNEVAVY